MVGPRKPRATRANTFTSGATWYSADRSQLGSLPTSRTLRGAVAGKFTVAPVIAAFTRSVRLRSSV